MRLRKVKYLPQVKELIGVLTGIDANSVWLQSLLSYPSVFPVYNVFWTKLKIVTLPNFCLFLDKRYHGALNFLKHTMISFNILIVIQTKKIQVMEVLSWHFFLYYTRYICNSIWGSQHILLKHDFQTVKSYNFFNCIIIFVS